MTTSTSKGPLDAIPKARWRVEQLNVAKDFVEIFDNIKAVILEGQEANEPTSYQPKRWASFKPPKYKESQKNFTNKKVPDSKKKTWSCKKRTSNEIDDVEEKEAEERVNTSDVIKEVSMLDAEEVNEIQDTGVYKHRNRKKKTCCPMCAKEDGNKKSQTKKKQNKEKDGKEHTESVFERAARIMKRNVQKPPQK